MERRFLTSHGLGHVGLQHVYVCLNGAEPTNDVEKWLKKRVPSSPRQSIFCDFSHCFVSVGRADFQTRMHFSMVIYRKRAFLVGSHFPVYLLSFGLFCEERYLVRLFLKFR